MSVLDRRWVRLTVSAVIAFGLVAVSFVDVAVAQQRRAHDRKVAAARALHRAETRYLTDVRKIAGDVYNVVQPYQQVLDAFISDPETIVAARDAFAVPTPAKQVTALIARLDALTVPKTMHAHQAKLRAALSGYVTHLTAVRRQAKVNDYQKLYDAINNGFEGDFDGDSINWQYALQDTFAEHKDAPPRYPVSDATAPLTLVTWVFRADRACDHSFDLADAALVRFAKKTETPADFGVIAKSLQSFTATMRKVPLPADQKAALNRDVMQRLPVVDSSARALAAFTRALEKRDPGSLDAAVRKILAAGTAVKPLVAAFRSRNVTICTELLVDMVQISAPTNHGGSLQT